MAVHADDSMLAEITEMVDAGMTITEMGNRLFVKRDVMRRILKECNLYAKNRGGSPTHEEREAMNAFVSPRRVHRRIGLYPGNDPLMDALLLNHPYRRYQSLNIKKSRTLLGSLRD